MKSVKNISTFEFIHPQSNLPAIKAGSIPESVFTAAFTESYWRNATKLHSGTSKTKMCFAREIPVSGLGIADLVSVAWNPAKERHVAENSFQLPELKCPTVRAFEMKLENWKKGLMQAHRYRFFSDSSILVLPVDKIVAALEHIDLFEKLQVGLWSYNPVSGSIRLYHTPRPIRPQNGKHRGIALQRVWESATAAPCA